MKTIGLLGGMSWESSIIYYKLINELIKEKLGDHNSAQSLMYSVNFQEIKTLQHEGEWEKATQIMIEASKKIECGGADFLIICTNTMHKMANEVELALSIPLLHIADATAIKIMEKGIKKVGLLATEFTMEEDFYKGRLKNKYGLNVLVPNEEDRKIVHNIIYQELCLGKIFSQSKEKYIKIIDNLIKDGAEAIILGCTEITLLVSQEDCKVPVFDTTRIHAQCAVEYALNKENVESVKS
ncbi:aspartate racemase [Bacillus cereus]|uniref:aspartate/glutamate racemase family protein n=1 Tax=Bacillus nitratireducens TaxID=2026193 RepID=UPI000BF5D3C9|nr:aspartate racemase [Bacillus cereus]PGV62773.1 aspartate racemase [Bacillus cereus]